MYSRSYRGRIKALVLDWSGTLVDAFVMAPTVVFVEVFAKQGVEISMSEARIPMGLRKDLHIEKLANYPKIRERWKSAKGRYPTKRDIDAMYRDFVPLQLECLAKYATLLPGVAETALQIQDEGVKIGITTGFTRAMVDVLLTETDKQEFYPDATVAGDDVKHGVRPAPFMLYRNLELMNVHPIESVIKVDDTLSGIEEGLAAGCWAVGIAGYSNYMDINSLEEAESLPQRVMERKLANSRLLLNKGGAHYVIDEFSQLPEVIDKIGARLQAGEKP